MIHNTNKEGKMKTRLVVVHAIPGGWYGNECGSFDNDANAGNVVVNPSKAHLALKWLQRKRFDVVGLFIVDEQNGHGLGITYRKKN